MPRFLYRVVLFFVVVMQVTACSGLFGRGGYFRDRADDYLTAIEIPPMKVPRNLDSGSISELFVIPPITNEYVDPEKEFEVPIPNKSAVLDQAQVKIQKLNDRRWITINSNPAAVWPRVKQFLASQGLVLSQEDPLNGLLDTVWLTLPGEADSKDRYRILVEQGLHSSTTEIHLLQMTAPMGTPGAGSINWPSRSVNPEREKWMLDKLAGYLADSNNTTISLLAQSIGQQQKVSFVQPYQAESYLLLQIDIERAIASVGGAVNRLPFVIVEAFQGEGYFLVTFDPEYNAEDDPEKELGFFAKLFGGEKRREVERRKRLLHYRVDVQVTPTGYARVTIRKDNEEILEPEERNRLLQVIRKQLI